MKKLFKPMLLKSLIFILILLVVAKLEWFVVEVLFLPTKGVQYIETQRTKALYYRVKLTSKKPPPKRVIKHSTPVTLVGSIKDIKLIAIYHDSAVTIVTIEYKKQSKVLSKGDVINGFILEDASHNFALFSKNKKDYKVFMTKEDTVVKTSSHRNFTRKKPLSRRKTKATGKIEKVGDHRLIDKSLIEHYAKNLKAIEKNIGIIDVRKGKNLVGFRVTFVRRGSPFAKLGLRRGDIISTVNGEKMTSYGAALGIYKNIGTIENLTLGIKRAKKEMELEYEIN